MVHLATVELANLRLVQDHPLVAVFTGATRGIGLSTLNTLAATHSTTGKGLRAYIVGRSEQAGATIISDCLKLCPTGDFCFVQVSDLSMLADVDKACEKIIEMEGKASSPGNAPRVDLLCMSQGELSMEPNRNTREGLEFRVSPLYYSRMRTIVNLIPLLVASSTPAHVISVFAAGKEGELHLNDISMRTPKYQGIAGTRSHVTYMTTFFFEWLAAQHPGKLSLVHVFPGLILTDGFNHMPVWFRAIWILITPILGLFCTSLAECGQRILFMANNGRFPAQSMPSSASVSAIAASPIQNLDLDTAVGTDLILGSGAYGVNLDGETIPAHQVHRSYDVCRAQAAGEKIVAHTLQAFNEIKAGKVFTA